MLPPAWDELIVGTVRRSMSFCKSLTLSDWAMQAMWSRRSCQQSFSKDFRGENIWCRCIERLRLEVAAEWVLCACRDHLRKPLSWEERFRYVEQAGRLQGFGANYRMSPQFMSGPVSSALDMDGRSKEREPLVSDFTLLFGSLYKKQAGSHKNIYYFVSGKPTSL